MKKLTSLLFVAFALNSLAQPNYAKQNISLLGNWYDPSVVKENTYGIKYQAVVGYAQNGREYAIIGSTAGTYFIDVTNPSSLVQRDYVKGRRSGCIWREFAIYGKYCYMVSDDGAPNSLQIADLSYLPDSVHVVYDDNAIFERSHTVFVDNGRLYCGGVTKKSGGGSYSMAVYSLANPQLPVFLRSLNMDYPSINYVHDMWVDNDTVFASGAYQGLFVYRYDAINNKFIALDQLTNYPDQGYNHSGTLTPNRKTFVFCDEVPNGKAVKVIDVSQFGNISVKSTFKSNVGATPHNPYSVGNDRVVIAYYQDGVQIYDISNPSVPVKTGYFDTDTLHGLNDNFTFSPAYHGNWGAWPYLPSKRLLASDMQNGLYVLDATAALYTTTGVSNAVRENKLAVYPNPFDDRFTMDVELAESAEAVYEVTDIGGRVVLSGRLFLQQGSNEVHLETGHLAKGFYTVRLSSGAMSAVKKVAKN